MVCDDKNQSRNQSAFLKKSGPLAKIIRMSFRSINPASLAVKDLHQYILGMVSPRPIAFASTMDEDGRPNLAPYSFFNAFSSNPPILVFSSNRKVKDNQTKDTLHNIERTGEVVINTVNFAIMRQMALTSIEYPPEVNEFIKAGLTPIPSDTIKPFRVAESPAQMECKVKEIIALGDQGGAGHLIICEVTRIHIREEVIDDKDRIDPHKMDLVGRMGRAYYVRASGAAIHTLFQPVDALGMGFDQLPASIRHSPILTGSELAEIAALLVPPSPEELLGFMDSEEITHIMKAPENKGKDQGILLHEIAKNYIQHQKTEAAAIALYLADSLIKK
jgi:flavin reductase (DIM6/NTAB) family NADH-FMN oxidoreductase RutF